MKKILYKFATRSRPQKFLNCIENIHQLSASDNFEILVTADVDDPSMNDSTLVEILQQYPKVKIHFGENKTKVQAINAGMAYSGEYDILCVHSDDMIFVKHGYDMDIREAFEYHDGLVHFPDQMAKDRLITYPMMTRKYYEMFGYIYNPQYTSVYCDNEQHEVAQLLNKYKFVNKEILKHNHPQWGLAQFDDLVRRNEDPINYKLDNAIFLKRKENNFGIPKS